MDLGGRMVDASPSVDFVGAELTTTLAIKGGIDGRK